MPLWTEGLATENMARFQDAATKRRLVTVETAFNLRVDIQLRSHPIRTRLTQTINPLSSNQNTPYADH